MNIFNLQHTEADKRKILILIFGIFHGQHFENVEHGTMYSHIVTDNITICLKNIYQVLKHVLSFPNMYLAVNIINYHK